MKQYNGIIRSMKIFLMIMASFCQVTYAQGSKADKEAAQIAVVKGLVEAKGYFFSARSVSPMSGRTRQLTSTYFLKVSVDTIVCDLPYFGRAYTASIGTTDGGIDLTSTDFEYTATTRKKGGWNIVIKIKDKSDVREMDLTIFETGSASLQVSSNSRQSISFDGSIVEKL